jgi:hypothetical protein
MYACFYDNNVYDQNLLYPYIKFFKVVDTPMFTVGDDEALALLMEKESPSVQNIFQMYQKHYNHSYYDPLSAQTAEDFVEHVCKQASHASINTFVFDWDRTLQPFECMSKWDLNKWSTIYGAETDMERKEFVRALAIYHAGGQKRFEKLCAMFRFLREKKKSVYILTANSAVNSPGKDIYEAILSEWGVEPCVVAYAHNKYVWLNSNVYLQTCIGPVLSF